MSINEETPAVYNQTKSYDFSDSIEDLTISELYERVTGEVLPQGKSIRELAKTSEKAAMVIVQK